MTSFQDNSAAVAPAAASLEGAARLLGSLLADAGRNVDRGQIRRVIQEAVEADPGDAGECWWNWVREAGTNLGLKCKVVDCTPYEIEELAQQGGRLVIFVSGDDPWRAIAEARGRKFRVRDASAVDGRWMTASRLRKLLDVTTSRAMIRCVLVEPSLAYGEMASDRDNEMTALSRLWALLSPERADILILLIFSLVVGLLSLATPIAVDALVSTVAFGRMFQPVVLLALLLFAFLAFAAALRALKTYVVEIVQCRLFARVTADLAYRLPRLQTAGLERQYLPELVNRYFDIVTVQKVTASLLLNGLQLLLNAVVGMAVLAFYHPWLLGFDVVLILLLAFVVFVLGRGAGDTSMQESKCKYAAASWLEDLARAPVSFKLYGAGEFAMERGDLLIHEYLVARKKHFRVLMRQVIFALGIQVLASAVLLGIGGWLVMQGQLTLGQLVAAELIVTVIVGSFAKMGKSMESFYDLIAAVDKLGVLFDLPVEHQEGVLTPFPERPASLIVHGVDAAALDEGPSELNALHIEIAAGERVILAGAASRLLLDLIYGLRDPSHGHLTVDGIDTRDLRPDMLRRRVALVRGIEVFQGSIAENVHLGRPEIMANVVRDVLEEVDLLHDVSRLSDGIASEVNSGGAPLDQYQLSRLMLARAIAGRPGLLLIDGMLDGLADDEAAELMQVLCDPRQSWTLIVVTRRKSLYSLCTRVIDLDAETLATEIDEPGDGA
jgi:putative ABC transport system ATP-binding protein